MQNVVQTPSDADWQRLRRMLDETISELGHDDHDALALRFYEDRSFAEIGRSE